MQLYLVVKKILEKSLINKKLHININKTYKFIFLCFIMYITF